MICLSAWWSALNAWKNSSCVCVFAGEELDVVDEQEIALLAVARAELVHPLVLQRLTNSFTKRSAEM